MNHNIKKPSVRMDNSNNFDEWLIDTDCFGEGPDNWSSSKREGWRFYLVETIPYRDIYALCKYSWRTDREDVITDIGRISIEPNLDKDELNRVFEDNGVKTLSDGQYNLIESAVGKCLTETVRNATLDKGFEIFDHNVYVEFDEPEKYLMSKISKLDSKYKEMKKSKENGESLVYYKKEEVDRLESFESLSEEHTENLNLIWRAIDKPHRDTLTRVKHCQIAGQIDFKTLEPFQLRAIELVQNGVFNGHEAVAVVYALKEEGFNQKEIADELGKDESTVSKQAKIARNLTNRARWHTHNVTTDTN